MRWKILEISLPIEAVDAPSLESQALRRVNALLWKESVSYALLQCPLDFQGYLWFC